MNLILRSALASIALFAVAWLASALLRRAPADLRCNLWRVAILAAGVLPVLMWVAPESMPGAIRVSVPAAFASSGPMSSSTPWMSWAGDAWLIGASVCLLRLVIGWLRIYQLTRAAWPTSEDRVLISDRVTAPLTWGVLRPMILLPAYAENWSEQQRSLALSHERAHIARHDWLWQTLSRIVAAVFWFQPLIWIALAALRREAELAVDDRVIAAGASEPEYARQLLEVARRMNGAAPALAVAMVSRGSLENRVSAILDLSRNRARASRIARVSIVLAAGALLFPAVALHAQVYHVGGDVTSPRVISKVEPEYTEEARAAKIQGTVGVELQIDEAGVPHDIQVVQSLDPGLDANAVKALYRWKFAPATKGGQPVRVSVQIQVNFRLM